MSALPEKLGKSSKWRMNSPCSPHEVGEAEADAEVLLAEVVELRDLEPVLVEELVDAEVELELNTASEVDAEILEVDGKSELEVVTGPLASELPIVERACVLGDAEDMSLLVGMREKLEATVETGLNSGVAGLIEP